MYYLIIYMCLKISLSYECDASLINHSEAAESHKCSYRQNSMWQEDKEMFNTNNSWSSQSFPQVEKMGRPKTDMSLVAAPRNMSLYFVAYGPLSYFGITGV